MEGLVREGILGIEEEVHFSSYYDSLGKGTKVHNVL